jgi:hypothetical protein
MGVGIPIEPKYRNRLVMVRMGFSSETSNTDMADLNEILWNRASWY